MENIFKALELPYVMGKVWTTDAIYRETRNLVEKRKSEGCIAVEMELAGMQAVCDFYNIELYDFLVTGDIVDQLEYTSEGLHDANHNLDKFYVALKISHRPILYPSFFFCISCIHYWTHDIVCCIKKLHCIAFYFTNSLLRLSFFIVL